MLNGKVGRVEKNSSSLTFLDIKLRIVRLPVQTLLSPWPSFSTQPCSKAPDNFRIEILATDWLKSSSWGWLNEWQRNKKFLGNLYSLIIDHFSFLIFKNTERLVTIWGTRNKYSLMTKTYSASLGVLLEKNMPNIPCRESRIHRSAQKQRIIQHTTHRCIENNRSLKNMWKCGC